jgi:hydroxymethylpyrimidine pyrophosphatase-like HAD family hydrolase
MAELSADIQEGLDQLLTRSGFSASGGVVTDLDGTALHEDQGRIYIPKTVEIGFKHLHDLGRPFVLNSLRFPLSVMRTFGRDWYAVSNSPIPSVTLNGSLLGYVTQGGDGAMGFEEIAAFPLTAAEIDQALESVRQLLEHDIREVLLFYYPRDWRAGEIIWTPFAENVSLVQKEYVSASRVTADELEKLCERLHAEDICMIFLLVDAPEERLMAYQYASRGNFLTREGVDKLFGARQIAALLRFDLESSIGAGDTEMDLFLNGVGLAVVVGGADIQFHGVHGTLRLRDSFELGELLFQAAVRLARNGS